MSSRRKSRKKSYFKIKIRTKPFLKKYLLAKYGDPLIFSTDNYFGISLAGLLQRPLRIHKNKDLLRMRTDRFMDVLEIQCPISFLTKDVLGCDLTDSQEISLNKLFEEKFEEELTFFCTLLNVCGVETKDALEEFCRSYNIEVDTDISYDALQKKEYRYRKMRENMTDRVSPKARQTIQQTFEFFAGKKM